jgi:hypothetical protein
MEYGTGARHEISGTSGTHGREPCSLSAYSCWQAAGGRPTSGSVAEFRDSRSLLASTCDCCNSALWDALEGMRDKMEQEEELEGLKLGSHADVR